MNNNAIPQIRMPGYNHMELLDGSTRLKMLEQSERPRALAMPMAQNGSDEATKRAARAELAAAMTLIFGFTLLFWVLLGLVRGH